MTLGDAFTHKIGKGTVITQSFFIYPDLSDTSQYRGTFNFGSATGNPLADFEAGYVSNFIQGGGLYLNFTGINWSAFVQDDWKATRRLTLSAGLRWDPWIPSKDSLGRYFR